MGGETARPVLYFVLRIWVGTNAKCAIFIGSDDGE